jgi:single-strand DNA-binding protein
MNHLNSILLEGELAGNPDYRSDEKGNPVCRFSIASNRFFKSDGGLEQETCRFDVETGGKLALQCKEQGREGRGVRVVGRLKQEHGRDTEGKPVSRILIVAEHVEFRPSMVREQKQPGLNNHEDYEMGR